MSSRPHVIVVGAGPAGSVAATLLARGGARVTVLEKGRFPRDKVCGDGVSPRGLALLRRIGYDPPLTNAARMTRARLVAPDGHVVDVPLPPAYGGEGRVIRRVHLDRALAELAARAGADIHEGVTVAAVETDDHTASARLADGRVVSGDVLLGCDGAPSIVRKSLRFPAFAPRHTGVAYRGYFEGVALTAPNAVAIYWLEELLPGYGWVFPLPDGAANIGVGLRMDQLRQGGPKIHDLFERFCRAAPIARQLHGATPEGRARGHLLPLASSRGQLHTNRALLLGDAAGFINPATGEGIEYAMESGELASEVLLAAAGRGRFDEAALAPYARHCERRFGTAFDLNHLLQGIFTRPWSANLLLHSIGRSRLAYDIAFDVAFGAMSTRTTRFVGRGLELVQRLRNAP